MELKTHLVKHGQYEVVLPYYELVGQGDGPTLMISGGIHGDEINGIYIVNQFVKYLKSDGIAQKLKGRLLIFPLLNPTGFFNRKRYLVEDGKDLNRQFGKEKPNSISEQVAYELTHNFLMRCQMAVDFHDAGEGAVLIPHARIHKSDAENCISCSRSLARIFGTEFILEREGHMNMMAVSMNGRHNIPVITVEIGGAQRISPNSFEIALTGIKNLLIANQMLEGDLVLPPRQYVVYKRLGVRILSSALIEFDCKLGDRVEKGRVIGRTYIPSEQRDDEIVAVKSGIIFSLWPDNQVRAGRTIYSILDTGSDPEQEGFEATENYQVQNMVY